MNKYPKISYKEYYCKNCKTDKNVFTTKKINTNHYGKVYTSDTYLNCPKCPPYKKYAWFGGGTTWICNEKPDQIN